MIRAGTAKVAIVAIMRKLATPSATDENGPRYPLTNTGHYKGRLFKDQLLAHYRVLRSVEIPVKLRTRALSENPMTARR